MKIGLFAINFGLCAEPDTATAVAKAAEEAGFESLWTGEHVVLPDPQVPPSPLPATAPMLDPAVSLSFLAAVTSKIRLGTGIIIVPQRNPLVLAKEMASLDVVSKGRLIFGVGIGYLEPEFRALNVPFDNKGTRTIEYLQAMRAIWTQKKPAFEGRYFSFSGVQSMPRPVQRPHPPIVFGGATPPAFQRAVEHGNGWYGFMLDVEGTRRCVQGLSTARGRTQRPATLGPLEVSVTPSNAVDAASARAYADLGVDRRILLSQARSRDDLLRFVDETARELIGNA